MSNLKNKLTYGISHSEETGTENEETETGLEFTRKDEIVFQHLNSLQREMLHGNQNEAGTSKV